MPLKKVLVDLGRGVWPTGSKKNAQKSQALFYNEPSETSPCRHIYYEPPEDFEWAADTVLLPNATVSSGEIVVKVASSNPIQIPTPGDYNPKDHPRKPDGSSRRAFTEEEFTSAILARTQNGNTSDRKDGLPQDVGDIAVVSTTDSREGVEPPEKETKADMCDKTSSNDNIRPCPEQQHLVNGDTSSMDSNKVCLRVSEGPNPEPGVSPVLERRNKSVLGRLKSFASRTSYSTSDDGPSHSSDYEEPEDMKVDMRFHRDAKERSSSWAGRVRHLHRDVKKKISRLRNSKGVNVDDETRECGENPDGQIQTGSSVESIPSGSGSSLQAPTPTSSNRSSTSAGEDETSAYVGSFIGRAKALVDYTPSPYDRDGLAFKKGDVIDIIAKHKTGIWVGMVQGKIGHFKFINVEEIGEECRPRQRRHRITPNWLSNGNKPKTLAQLLKQLGLEEYMNVLVLNGYEELDTFKEVEKEDLDGLGIVNPEHGQKLLRAAELLQGVEIEINEDEEQVVQSPRDSGCYASNENLNHKDSSLGQIQRASGLTEGDYVDTSYSESGIQSREGQDLIIAMNNLDLSAESSSKSTMTSLDSKQDDSVPTVSSEYLQTTFNILPSHNQTSEGSPSTPVVEIVLTNTISSNTDIAGAVGPFVPATTFAQSISSCVPPESSFSASQQTFVSETCISSTNISKPVGGGGQEKASGHSKTKHSRGKKGSHKPKHSNGQPDDENVYYYSYTFTKDGQFSELCVDSSSYLSGWSSFAKKKNKGLRRRAQEYDDVVSDPSLDLDSSPGRHVYKRAKQRKGSLQELVRQRMPPTLSLLSMVKQKLDDEGIHLFEEPYSDKTGFCGIPPALVQRYAEELQQNLPEVATAMDQIRISSLQQQARRGVPNDFLVDSCTIPVIEANYSCLYSWLISLGLPMYRRNFAMIGCYDLEQVLQISSDDLNSTGMRDDRHLHFLESAIRALQSRFGERSPGHSQPAFPVSQFV